MFANGSFTRISSTIRSLVGFRGKHLIPAVGLAALLLARGAAAQSLLVDTAHRPRPNIAICSGKSELLAQAVLHAVLPVLGRSIHAGARGDNHVRAGVDGTNLQRRGANGEDLRGRRRNPGNSALCADL